jgi:putative Holliday junction resolvase
MAHSSSQPWTPGPKREAQIEVWMRVMGLDLGSKTIGVAVSDELGLTAQPVLTLRRSGLRPDLAGIKQLASEHSVQQIVLGLPLNMDGTEGPMAKAAREFGAALEAKIGLPVEFWDERLSTAAAERALLEGDVSRKKRREVIDRLAASIILQSWLEARRTRAGKEQQGKVE